MADGRLVAAWLRKRIDPSRIYDHRVVKELEPAVHYDERTFLLWLDTGELAFMPTYSPAELLNHPDVHVQGITDPGPDARSTLGYEISAALHMLMWPSELPPGRVTAGWQACFDANAASIEERGDMPYRQDPPGGWWRTIPELAVTRRRR